MRTRSLGETLWVLVISAATAGCGLTLDYDPADIDGGSQADLDAGTVDGGSREPCSGDSECLDDVFCNGEEHCVEGFCEAGSPPCAAPAACTTTSCDETARTCEGVPVACPSGQICNPETSVCQNAPSCTIDSDCPNDDIQCNGSLVCRMGSCVPSEVTAACEDLDGIACTVPTCTIDGCVELGVDAMCGDPVPDDCMVPHCSGDGCILVPSDAACDDGHACTVDVCAPSTEPGSPGLCRHVPTSDATVCDDGAECTTDACNPLALLHDGNGCTHEPNDDACSTGTLLQCGSGVCVGADALAAYPSRRGCAPSLDSEACPLASHCVGDGSGLLSCVSFLDGCSTDTQCSDGNPCNGIEQCVAGRCARGTVGCPEMACATAWCDLTSSPPSCEYRIDPDCTATP